MTSKDKALSIVEKCAIWHWNAGVCEYEESKQCALICVEEILEVTSLIEPYLGYDFYLEVKEELLKL